jgi:hypothetical protein
MRSGLVYHPLIAFGGKSHQTRGKMRGKGAGSVLLDGGLGGQSSYSSIDEYINATGRNPNTLSNMGGMGMVRPLPSPMKKEAMNDKIKSMMVKPAKVKNIKFNL